MNIGKISNICFTGPGIGHNHSKDRTKINNDNIEMNRLRREDILKVGEKDRNNALKTLDIQHEALFTALNYQMLQNHFEVLNKLDKIEKQVDEIHWDLYGKKIDPLAPFM